MTVPDYIPDAFEERHFAVHTEDGIHRCSAQIGAHFIMPPSQIGH